PGSRSACTSNRPSVEAPVSIEQPNPAAPAAEAEGGRFNISRGALEHPALTRYMMIVLLLLGVAAYFQLGQDEDPPFTFRAMVVQAYWPGASATGGGGQGTHQS